MAKTKIKKILVDYIARNGQKAVDELDILVQKADKILRSGAEVKEKIKEHKQADDILSKLNDE